jgi:hypothetical protein
LQSLSLRAVSLPRILASQQYSRRIISGMVQSSTPFFKKATKGVALQSDITQRIKGAHCACNVFGLAWVAGICKNAL